MVAYPTAVLLEHPHAVLLRGIDVLHTTACQPLEIKVGEGLVRAVVLRTHETVELAVVHRHEPFLELRRLLFEPFGEAVTYLVNLGVGELYALGIAHLDVVAVLVLTDALHHVGTGVVQGVLQQAHAVVVAVVALHAELVPDLDVLAVAHGGELVHAGGIGDADIGLVEVAHVGGVDARGYPPFAEVEVEFLEGDALWSGILQCLQRLFSLRQMLMLPVIGNPCLDALRLVDDIPGNEAVADFVIVRQRVEIDPAVEGSEQFLLGGVSERAHVVEMNRAVPVERGGQGFLRRVGLHDLIHREGHGTLEDVGLDELPVLLTLQGKDVASCGIHQQQFHVLLGVEVAVAQDKLVVVGVEVASLRLVLLVVLRLIAVQTLVGITQGDVEHQFLFLKAIEVSGMEHRSVGREVFQIAHVP